MNPPDKKHCRKCGVELVVGENWYESYRHDKYHLCMACARRRAMERWSANRVHYNARQTERRNANIDHCREVERMWKQKKALSVAISKAKRRAMKNGVAHCLTANDVRENVLCPALGVKMRWTAGTGGFAPESKSLDRIVTSAGYTLGNVCIISHRANSIKSNATPEESLAVALYSYTYTGHSVSDIHAAVDAILAKQAEYRRINEEARSLEVPAQEKAS